MTWVIFISPLRLRYKENQKKNCLKLELLKIKVIYFVSDKKSKLLKFRPQECEKKTCETKSGDALPYKAAEDGD